MTPEDKELLDTHVKAMPAAGYAYAKILYKNTPSEKIETFEGIETAVRDQVLEHVSPKIAFFFVGDKTVFRRSVWDEIQRIIHTLDDCLLDISSGSEQEEEEPQD